MSNELGAGNPRVAKVALCIAVILAVAEYVVASIILFACRSILGYAFSNEKEVVDYVNRMTPLLCLSIIMDSTQAILSGNTPFPLNRMNSFHHLEHRYQFSTVAKQKEGRLLSTLILSDLIVLDLTYDWWMMGKNGKSANVLLVSLIPQKIVPPILFHLRTWTKWFLSFPGVGNL